MVRCLILCLTLGSVSLAVSPLFAADNPQAEIISVEKIWDQAPHNAFTDLVRFQDRWFCVFREGQKHVSKDGALRVLSSVDGKNWKSAALITSDTADLRDAKISVTPDGRLCLAGAGALHQPAAAKHQSYVWYSDDGTDWSTPTEVGDPNFWLWRIAWHNGNAYGIGYGTSGARAARFYKSTDGKTFEQVGQDFEIDGYMNETGLVFLEDDTALCLIRRDGKPNDALLGTSKPPYSDWQWKSTNTYVGGPQLVKLDDGRFIVGGRSRTHGAKTTVWELEPKTATLTPLADLPSGGDTSYPGIVDHDRKLWVSYYSSHEGKTSIYLAKLKLPETPSSK
ncbi:sialidase family protein [Bremerella alba]|uniref:Exo-alpha-sialidase n=1 Tax=Bremerella alba TaxID=980252 RepID=A0A7V9A5Z0_9BACT|nr:sialidase family protein [Bremerella alba]MBA2113717.1 hypothetical protein [Bremerella alba]